MFELMKSITWEGWALIIVINIISWAYVIRRWRAKRWPNGKGGR